MSERADMAQAAHRRSRAGGRRAAVLALALLVLAAAWLGPLPALVAHSFAAHMAIHVTVVTVAAPLLAGAMAGGRCDPVRRAPALFAPVPTSLLEMAVVWSWHAPLLHHWSRHSGWGLVLEQGKFLAAGTLVWLAGFGGDPATRHERRAAGMVGLLLAAMHMTLLGALLALAPRTLYGHAGPAAMGLTALEDQQLGGVLMLLVAGTAYLAGSLCLLGGLLRSGEALRSPGPWASLPARRDPPYRWRRGRCRGYSRHS